MVGAMSRSNRTPVARICAGFTFLWVLLLVALMGLGLTMGVEIYTTSAQRDKEKELLAIGRQFRTAIGRYYEMQIVNGKHEYPASLDDLLLDNRMPGIRRHLRKVFVDPMTGKPEWGMLRTGGRIVGMHSLSGRTPIKQDHFEADDIGLRAKEKYSDWVFTYPPDLLLRADIKTLDSANPAVAKPPGNSPPQGGSANNVMQNWMNKP